MTPRSKKALSIGLRTTICVGAMYLVLRGVHWHDWAYIPGEAAAVHAYRILDWAQVENDERLNQPVTTGEVEITVLQSENSEPTRIRLDKLARNSDGSPRFEIGLVTVWKSSSKRLFGLAFLMFGPVGLIQSIRFTWMVRAQDIELSYWEGIKLSYAGNFMNYLAIGSTGGDIFKAYYVAGHTHRKTEAVTTVLLDRAIGLISLIIIAALAMLLKMDDPAIRSWWSVIGVLMASLLAGCVVVFSRRVRHWLRVDAILKQLPFSDQLIRIDAATHRLRHHKKLVALCLLVTLILQGLAIAAFVVCGFGLGMRSDPDLYAGYFVFISIGLLVAAVPISYQGVGTMDGVLQLCFRGVYGNYSQILFLGFVVRILQLVWSLPGFLVPITGAHRPSSEKIAQLQSLVQPSKS